MGLTINTCKGLAIDGSKVSSYWTQPFHDSANGSVIDTNKWDQTIVNANAGKFVQNNGLVMQTLVDVCSSSYNIIKTKVSQESGYWKFSVMDMGYPTHVARYRRFGLMSNGVERIRFERKTSQALIFTMYINYGGSDVYSFDTTIYDLAQIKISISKTHDIKVYQWTNDAWVQIGATQNYDLGALKVYMLTLGNTYFEKTSLRDVFIIQKDFTTANPGNVGDPTSGIDVRSYGAVPDGTTDCATAINNALAVGDVILKNGAFALNSSIVIPSNRTIYIRNAKVRLNNNHPDNFFRNSDFTGGNSYINIVGLGHAVLDSNSVNNDDSYTTWGTDSFSSNAWHYNGILLCNVAHFSISGINFSDRLHYGIMMQKSSYGVLDDLFLGFRLNSLLNQDGINMTWGSHDIAITNVDIISTDDVFAVGAGTKFGFNVQSFAGWNTGDVFNITRATTNIYYTTNQSKLLCLIVGNGNKVHDISISNVKADIIGSVMCSDYPTYITTPPVKTDVYNITFDSIVVGQNDNAALFQIGGSMKDITVTNLTNNTAKPLYSLNAGLDLSNFTINGTVIDYTTDLFARMTALSETPDATRKSVLNTAIKGANLFTVPLWTNKFDALWLLAAHASGSSLLNIIKNANNATLVSTPTFNADRGYTGNGTSAAINTHYNLSSDSVLFTEDYCSIGVYLRNNAEDHGSAFSAEGTAFTNGTWLTLRNTDHLGVYAALNSNYSVIANGDSSGMWIMTRTDHTHYKIYHNGTVFFDGSGVTAAALVNVILHLLCHNVNGTLSSYSIGQVALAFVGGQMSQADVTNFQTIWVDGYLNSIGAKV